MSCTLTSSSMAMKARKRAVSSTPAMPTTRWRGKPVASFMTYAITSRGFDTTITTASGATRAISRPTECTIPALVRSRSSRLIPGLRAIPAVTTTRSEPSAGP